MALTQTATHPGPSWDEEVVPALRKRLESESRTLARRISAISLSSAEDVVVDIPTPRRQNTEHVSPAYRSQQMATTAATLNGYHTHDRTMPPPPRVVRTPSTSSKPAAPSFQRSRTYSQPFTSDSTTPRRPSPKDVKPTRIPVASRPTNASSVSLVHAHALPSSSTSPPPPLPTTEQSTASSKSTFLVPRSSDFGLLNEQPPFSSISTGTSANSIAVSYIPAEQPPPRLSIDSEERPFEHWYRGDTSRNGGVGELRIGKRQEMLDIANYGHQKALAARGARNDVYEHRFRRKRADSIAGLTKKERERGSVYLDEQSARELGGLVMDEHPLTDLESEVESVRSAREFGAYELGRRSEDTRGAYSEESERPPVPTGDVFDPLPAQILDSYHGARSPTPTQASIRKPQIHSSINGTRIPRRSMESSTPSPPPTAPTATTPTASSSSTPSRSPKPPPKSPNATPGKSKSPAGRKKPQRKPTASTPRRVEEDKSEPVEDGEDLKDAIPSWTQPVRQGNWDEVVLPVVARQKGLNGLYETADGSPQPKKTEEVIAPAPGTFGYDHTKYRRPPRNTNAPLEMDEFGRPNPPTQPVDEEPSNPPPPPPPPPPMNTISSAHDETPLPVRSQPMFQEKPKPKVRPVDPSELGLDLDGRTSGVAASETKKVEKMQVEEPEVDSGAGCCKCVIM